MEEEKLAQPVGWRILVKMPEPKTMSEGGIALTGATSDILSINATRGEVIAMGSACYADTERVGEPWCKVGDTIDIVKYAGKEVKREDTLYRYISDEDVLGVVPE